MAESERRPTSCEDRDREGEIERDKGEEERRGEEGPFFHDFTLLVSDNLFSEQFLFFFLAFFPKCIVCKLVYYFSFMLLLLLS